MVIQLQVWTPVYSLYSHTGSDFQSTWGGGGAARHGDSTHVDGVWSSVPWYVTALSVSMDWRRTHGSGSAQSCVRWPPPEGSKTFGRIMNRFIAGGSEHIQARQGTKTSAQNGVQKCWHPWVVFFYCVIRKLSLKYFNVAQVINTSYPTSSIYYIHQKPSGNFSKTSCETTAINQNFGERFILSVWNVSKHKIKRV